MQQQQPRQPHFWPEKEATTNHSLSLSLFVSLSLSLSLSLSVVLDIIRKQKNKGTYVGYVCYACHMVVYFVGAHIRCLSLRRCETGVDQGRDVDTVRVCVLTYGERERERERERQTSFLRERVGSEKKYFISKCVRILLCGKEFTARTHNCHCLSSRTNRFFCTPDSYVTYNNEIRRSLPSFEPERCQAVR